jgi:hypothetical protein
MMLGGFETYNEHLFARGDVCRHGSRGGPEGLVQQKGEEPEGVDDGWRRLACDLLSRALPWLLGVDAQWL